MEGGEDLQREMGEERTILGSKIGKGGKVAVLPTVGVSEGTYTRISYQTSSEGKESSEDSYRDEPTIP